MAARPDLNEVYEGVPRFRLRYAHRSPRCGRGLAHHGVRSMSIVEEYARCLGQAYDTLTTSEYGWEPLSSDRVPVYIYSLPRPCLGRTGPARYGAAYIELTNEGDECDPAGALRRMRATAAHELLHYLQFNCGADNRWRWLNEASAVAVEPWVFEGNVRYLCHLREWFTRPERSVDDGSGYGASVFIGYLGSRLGPSIVRHTYEEGKKSNWGWQAIEALARAVENTQNQKPVLAFASATKRDIFAAGYCADAYFLQDPEQKHFDNGLYDRYGERAVTDTFCKYPVPNGARNDPIDHLGCRYYRFRPVDGHAKLTVKVTLPTPEAREFLRGELIGVTRNMSRGVAKALKRSRDRDSMSANLKDFTKRDLDHAVLVIANCAYGFGAPNGLTFGISADV